MSFKNFSTGIKPTAEDSQGDTPKAASSKTEIEPGQKDAETAQTGKS